jgi:hypothetical protein
MGYQACSDCISNCQRKHSKEKEKLLPHEHAKEAAAANELEKPAFMKKMLEGPMTSTMVHPHRILPHVMYYTSLSCHNENPSGHCSVLS